MGQNCFVQYYRQNLLILGKDVLWEPLFYAYSHKIKNLWGKTRNLAVTPRELNLGLLASTTTSELQPCFTKQTSLVLAEEDPSGSKHCKMYDEVLWIWRLIRLFSHEYLCLTYPYSLRPKRQVVRGLDYLKLTVYVYKHV